MRTPNVIICNGASPCDCLDNEVFTDWYSKICSNATNATTNLTTKVDAVFDRVDSFSIFLALCTGVAMVAIIFLSVLFSRYRRKQREVIFARRQANKKDQILMEQKRELDMLKAKLSATKTEIESIEFAFRDVERDDGITFISFLSLEKIRGLGSGAFGEVYSAAWSRENNKRVVAVKEMHRQHLTKENLSCFKAEIKILSRVSHHQNIVSFHGASWDQPPHVAILLEYMEGGDLHGFIYSPQEPNDPIATRLYNSTANLFARDVARGLSYLHAFSPAPIIHRDIKPDNVLLSSGFPRAKIADLGEARFKTGSDYMTIVGTPIYTAPEILSQSCTYVVLLFFARP